MKRPFLFVQLAVAIFLLGTRAEARKLEPQDYFSLEAVGAPQISPDGKSIIYARSKVNIREDRRDVEQWIINADGSGNRLLMAGGQELRWSPDGTRIAYIGMTKTGGQIFVRAMDGSGEVRQVTSNASHPYYLSWAPDGRSIAFMSTVPTPATWKVSVPGKPADANWAEEPLVVDTLQFRADGIGRVRPGFAHIFVVPAEGGAPRQLTNGDWHAEARGIIASTSAYAGPPEWTKDSKEIIFSSDRKPGSDTRPARADLYAVKVADGSIRSLTQDGGFWGMFPGARVSPDGRRLAYVGSATPGTSNFPSEELRVLNLDGSGERILIRDLPGYTRYVGWDSEGDGVYFVSEKEGTHHVRHVSLTGAVKDITKGSSLSFVLASTSRNGVGAGMSSGTYKPADIALIDLKTQKVKRLTAVNDDFLRGIELGKVEEIRYDSSDDTRVQGWIIYPPDFDKSKTYPFIVALHGGPEGMHRSDFDFYSQSLAAQGYVVLYPNHRGSTGYGGAFARGVYNQFPGRPAFDDVMKGVDVVVGRGFVDKQRMFVEGCSAGGGLTAWIVTQTDRFAAASAMCPMVNMISFVGSTDIPRWAYNRYEKPFWEDPKPWLDSSPIMQVGKVKTPTLVIAGANDIRTPVDQSLEFFSALKMRDVPTKLILFHDEWHGILRRPSNIVLQQLYVLKWYDEWRRLEEGGQPVWRNVAR